MKWKRFDKNIYIIQWKKNSSMKYERKKNLFYEKKGNKKWNLTMSAHGWGGLLGVF